MLINPGGAPMSHDERSTKEPFASIISKFPSINMKASGSAYHTCASAPPCNACSPPLLTRHTCMPRRQACTMARSSSLPTTPSNPPASPCSRPTGGLPTTQRCDHTSVLVGRRRQRGLFFQCIKLKLRQLLRWVLCGRGSSYLDCYFMGHYNCPGMRSNQSRG